MRGPTGVDVNAGGPLKQRESGLIVPAGVQDAVKADERRAEAQAEIERRRWVPKDRLVRQDGRKRKGAHTQDTIRKRYNRKSGLKGITGTR